MKKYVVALILVAFITNGSYGQDTKPVNSQLTRQEYLQKSKTQKIVAWVLLGAGVVSFAAVAPGNTSFNALGTVVVIGAISVISSIPLFIASARNKRKGMALSTSLHFEKISNAPFAWRSMSYIPALSVKLNL